MDQEISNEIFEKHLKLPKYKDNLTVYTGVYSPNGTTGLDNNIFKQVALRDFYGYRYEYTDVEDRFIKVEVTITTPEAWREEKVTKVSKLRKQLKNAEVELDMYDLKVESKRCEKLHKSIICAEYVDDEPKLKSKEYNNI